MGTNELDRLEQEWDAISRITKEVTGNKERQKSEILERCGISSLAPGGNNLSEPELDARFRDYLQTQRTKINHKQTFGVSVLTVIVAVGVLVAMILIAVFKD